MNSAPAIHKILGNIPGTDPVGRIIQTGDKEIYITITAGSDSGKGISVTPQSSAPRFCILNFVRPDETYFNLARDLPCYASAKDLISSKPEFRNETPGVVYSKLTPATTAFAAVKLLCDASNSKEPADPVKCSVKPFLPFEGAEPVCKDAAGRKTPWGSTMDGNYRFLCLGGLVPISHDSFKARR
jgi:hypothetical protein